MKQAKMEELLSIVNSHIKSGSISTQNITDKLSEYGMDSVSFIQIIVDIERKFDCEIPDSKLFISEMDTAEKIMDVLENLYYE